MVRGVGEGEGEGGRGMQGQGVNWATLMRSGRRNTSGSGRVGWAARVQLGMGHTGTRAGHGGVTYILEMLQLWLCHYADMAVLQVFGWVARGMARRVARGRDLQVARMARVVARGRHDGAVVWGAWGGRRGDGTWGQEGA